MTQRSAGYQVGYGKPPRHAQFKKGQSGNPKGRPKGSENFAKLTRRILNEKIVIRENGERRTITKCHAALKQLANKAASGDLRAIRELLKLRAEIAQQEATIDDKLVVQIVHFGEAASAADQSEFAGMAPKPLCDRVRC